MALLLSLLGVAVRSLWSRAALVNSIDEEGWARAIVARSAVVADLPRI